MLLLSIDIRTKTFSLFTIGLIKTTTPSPNADSQKKQAGLLTRI